MRTLQTPGALWATNWRAKAANAVFAVMPRLPAMRPISSPGGHPMQLRDRHAAWAEVRMAAEYPPCAMMARAGGHARPGPALPPPPFAHRHFAGPDGPGCPP